MSIRQAISFTNWKAPEGRPAAAEIAGLEAELAATSARFTNDFVNGLIGRRYNNYEHRSRVVRQMTTRLAAKQHVTKDSAS